MNSTPTAIATWLQAHSKAIDDTPLIILATRQDRPDVLEHLLSHGAALNELDQYGNNALWAACYAETNECIDLLLKHGIDINFQNSTGASALMYAASAGKTTVVAKLLQAGANATLHSQDDFTALDLAANRDCLKLLRNKQQD